MKEVSFLLGIFVGAHLIHIHMHISRAPGGGGFTARARAWGVTPMFSWKGAEGRELVEMACGPVSRRSCILSSVLTCDI